MVSMARLDFFDLFAANLIKVGKDLTQSLATTQNWWFITIGF